MVWRRASTADDDYEIDLISMRRRKRAKPVPTDFVARIPEEVYVHPRLELPREAYRQLPDDCGFITQHYEPLGAFRRYLEAETGHAVRFGDFSAHDLSKHLAEFMVGVERGVVGREAGMTIGDKEKTAFWRMDHDVRRALQMTGGYAFALDLVMKNCEVFDKIELRAKHSDAPLSEPTPARTLPDDTSYIDRFLPEIKSLQAYLGTLFSQAGTPAIESALAQLERTVEAADADPTKRHRFYKMLAAVRFTLDTTHDPGVLDLIINSHDVLLRADASIGRKAEAVREILGEAPALLLVAEVVGKRAPSNAFWKTPPTDLLPEQELGLHPPESVLGQRPPESAFWKHPPKEATAFASSILDEAAALDNLTSEGLRKQYALHPAPEAQKTLPDEARTALTDEAPAASAPESGFNSKPFPNEEPVPPAQVHRLSVESFLKTAQHMQQEAEASDAALAQSRETYEWARERARDVKRASLRADRRPTEYLVLTADGKEILSRENPLGADYVAKDIFTVLLELPAPERFRAPIARLQRLDWRLVGGGGAHEMLVFLRPARPPRLVARMLRRVRNALAAVGVVFLGMVGFNYYAAKHPEVLA